MSNQRYFENPFEDYDGKAEVPVEIHQDKILELIQKYVADILKHTKPHSSDRERRGDLYVGDAGMKIKYYCLSKISFFE